MKKRYTTDKRRLPKPFSQVTPEQLEKLKLESTIQEEIEGVLILNNIIYSVTDSSLTWNKKNSPRQKVLTGWPDITACVNGRFVAIECKSAGGRVRASQKLTLSKLEQAGALVILARSVLDVALALEKSLSIKLRLK